MKKVGHQVGGLAQLVTRFGNEITQVVQDIHGAVANPFGVRGHDYTPAPMIYNLIRYGFRQAGNAAGMADLLADPNRELRDSLDLQSIVNGIFGQLLVEQNSSYALPMTLLPKKPQAADTDTLVIFIHGLCMNDACWNTPAADGFGQWARRHLNAEVRYLRYNTGLHISDNGRKLAGLLAHSVLPKRLILVGHSMGGLVARSALHQGREREDSWVDKVTHLACLGSPHQGALLERIGNNANRLLATTPWSKPLMRLGNLRSDGIRDLRFGYVLEEQWRHRPIDEVQPSSKVPLDPTVKQLFIAGSVSEPDHPQPQGDWLVSVDSALARRLYPDAPQLTRELFWQMGHMTMIEENRTFARVQQWLEPHG
ncbi:GPI inositol-deacylase [Alcanivorax sp. S6407]|uniref:alpha/beta fold hydrolase n=1 Tax=Alcanivorax sp. S6407 TaxID=2926424 RepID=UPI001FF52CF5|nr:alpha/beta fold hydrolase [Alcanivorax sp. S6407]MCK0154697.1 GPI inositol-deacylase [Alcanivorax sp. S6407]